MIFGLTADDITNVFLAVAALIVAIRSVYEKVRAGSFFPVKSVEKKVEEITNGQLHTAVREAVRDELNDRRL